MEKNIEKLQDILKQDPSNFQARRELSVLLADNGFNDEALFNLKYLVKYFPEDAEIQYNIGILYEKLKELEKAKTAYEKAIKISPQEDFYYNFGEVLVSLNDWDGAIDCFKKVLQKDAQDGNCYFNLGLCYFNKDEVNLATDNFQKAIELNPQDIFAHFYLGNIYQNNGLTNFAIESYKKVLAISPDYSWAYFNMAAIAYKNENMEEAREYLHKTIECNNDDIEAYKLLTKIYIKEQNYEDIISILETRLEKEENGDLYYILARVYKYINDSENYLKNLENALKNKLTLNYSQDIIKKEIKFIEAQIKGLFETKEENYIQDYDLEEDSEEDEDYDDSEENFDEDFEEDDDFLDEDEEI